MRSVHASVSPPTRGWTLDHETDAEVAAGFPAHAGMDPAGSCRTRRRSWFPRPRGDGPVDDERSEREGRVSPPTRGWTPTGHAGVQTGAGFPAHAGMDPRVHNAFGGGFGFPRPRGDGPDVEYMASCRLGVSPPTRGWTLDCVCRLRGNAGFPAHAGMDPLPVLRTEPPRWFPRPRGDGPRTSSTSVRRWTVSPPTRGWTPDEPSAVLTDAGFPAHAGMDPAAYADWRSDERFPRPRGDGPYKDRWCGEGERVSPPTRGWTPDALQGIGLGLGFPAHAGMDPVRLKVTIRIPWFPRPRGDGPLYVAAQCAPESVSPPTRGWTSVSRADVIGIDGFPAHAGMDRKKKGVRQIVTRFPRPRGDGPAECWRYRRKSAVSPPTRGWTQSSRR